MRKRTCHSGLPFIPPLTNHPPFFIHFTLTIEAYSQVVFSVVLVMLCVFIMPALPKHLQLVPSSRGLNKSIQVFDNVTHPPNLQAICRDALQFLAPIVGMGRLKRRVK